MIVTFDKEVFAFNPVLIKVSGVDIGMTVILKSQGVTLRRISVNGTATFDIQALAQSLFNFKDSLFGMPAISNSPLVKELSFRVSDYNNNYDGVIVVRWGAIQIGETVEDTFKKKRVLKYFKNVGKPLPFSVPINVPTTFVGFPVWLSSDGNEPYLYKDDINGKMDMTLPFDAQRIIKLSSPNYPIDTLVRIANCTDGIYLRWLNSVGDWCYYLLSPANGSTATKSIDILDTTSTNMQYVNGVNIGTSKPRAKTITKKQKLYAALIDEYDFELLTSLVESVFILMYTGNDNWVGVNISDGTFTKNRDSLQDFECELVYPDKVNPSL